MRMRRAATIGAFLAVPLVAGAFLRQDPKVQDGARLFAQVLQRIEDNSVDSLSRSAIYEKAARGMVKNLKDPYADLYSPEEIASFQRNRIPRSRAHNGSADCTLLRVLCLHPNNRCRKAEQPRKNKFHPHRSEGSHRRGRWNVKSC